MNPSDLVVDELYQFDKYKEGFFDTFKFIGKSGDTYVFNEYDVESGDLYPGEVVIKNFYKLGLRKYVIKNIFPDESITFYDLPVFYDLAGYLCEYHKNTRKDIDGLFEFMFEIQTGIFTTKFVNPGKIDGYQTMRRLVKNFYKFCSDLKPADGYGGASGVKFSLYRNVKTRENLEYHPEDYKVGEKIEQILPFSTSVEPEFPVYIWADRQPCCLLKINCTLDDNINFMCLQSLNKQEMLKKMFEQVGVQYQSEITLGPGRFKVISLKKVIVPSKEEYRQHFESNSDYLMSIKSDGDYRDYRGFEHLLIEVNYEPYSWDKFKDKFEKYK